MVRRNVRLFSYKEQGRKWQLSTKGLYAPNVRSGVGVRCYESSNTCTPVHAQLTVPQTSSRVERTRRRTGRTTSAHANSASESLTKSDPASTTTAGATASKTRLWTATGATANPSTTAPPESATLTFHLPPGHSGGRKCSAFAAQSAVPLIGVVGRGGGGDPFLLFVGLF